MAMSSEDSLSQAIRHAYSQYPEGIGYCTGFDSYNPFYLNTSLRWFCNHCIYRPLLKQCGNQTICNDGREAF